MSGKKSKSVFDFLTYSRETGFSFSYEKVWNLHQAIKPSNEIDRVSKFDNSLLFGTKQNALRQIFFALWFFKELFTKNLNEIFFNFLWFSVGSIKECIYVYLSMQIPKEHVYEHSCSFVSAFLSILAHLDHLAQSILSDFKYDKWTNIFILV